MNPAPESDPTTDHTPRRRPQQEAKGPGTRRKLSLGWVLIAAAVITIALLAAAEASGWPFLRGPLERNLHRLAGVSVKADGDFRVHLLWNPGLSADRLTLGPADGVAAPHLLQADAVAVRWRWGDLWRFRQGDGLRVQSLTAKHIDAHLLRLADGRATWHLGTPAEPGAAAATQARPDPVIDHLQLDTGRLQLDDATLQLQLVALLQSQAADSADAAAGLALTAEGRYRGDAVKVRARAAGSLPLMASSLAGSASTSPMVDLSVDAQIARAHLVFAGQAAALLSASRLKGDLHLSGPSLAAVGEPVGLVLPKTPPFDLHGRIAHNGTVWSLVADRATIGSSALGGAFSYDTAAVPKRLSGRLTGSRLALKDLGPAIGTDQRPQRAGRVLPDTPLDLPRLSAMDANVLIDIGQLDLGTTALAPLMQVHSHLRLEQGVLQLDDLSAVAAGGKVSGSSRLDTRSALPVWTAALSFSGLDVAGWVRGVRKTDATAPVSAATAASAAAKAVAAPVPRAVLQRERKQALQSPEAPAQSYLTGLLDARVKVSGQGRSVADILGTLQGTTQVVVRDGTISSLMTEAPGLDLAHALGVVLRGDRSLPLRCARMDAQVQRGVLVPGFAVIDNADTTFRLSGRIDLRDETLALRLVAAPKAFSPLTLRSPITINGTLDKPVVSIDARRLGVRAAAALALAAAAPVAALIPFLEVGKTPATDPCRPDAASATPVRQKAPTG